MLKRETQQSQAPKTMPKHVNSRTCLGSDDQSITFSWDQQPNHLWLLHESCRTPSGNLWRCQPGPGAAVVLIALVPSDDMYQVYPSIMISECYHYCFGPPNKFNPGFIDPGIKGIEPSLLGNTFIHHHRPFLFGARIKRRWMVLFEGHSWNFMTIRWLKYCEPLIVLYDICVLVWTNHNADFMNKKKKEDHLKSCYFLRGGTWWDMQQA